MDIMRWYWLRNNEAAKKIADNIYFIKLPRQTEKVRFSLFFKKKIVPVRKEEKSLQHLLEHYLVGKLEKNHKDIDLEAIVHSHDGIIQINRVTTHKKFLYEFRIITDGLLKNPDFSDHSLLTAEKERVEHELSSRKSDAAYDEDYEIMKERFKDACGYGEYEGARDSSTISLEALRQYFNQRLLDSEIVTIIGASKLPAATRKTIIEEFPKFHGEKAATFEKKDEACAYSNFKIVLRPHEHTEKGYIRLTLSFPAPQERSAREERLGMNMIKNSLRRPRGQFMEQLYELGIYHAQVSYYSFKDVGMLSLEANVKKEKMNQLISLVLKEIKKLKVTGPSQEEMQEEIKKLLEMVKNEWSRNQSRYQWIVDDIIHSDEIVSWEETIRTLDVINVGLLKGVANKYLVKDSLNLLIFGDVEGISENEIKKYLDF